LDDLLTHFLIELPRVTRFSIRSYLALMVLALAIPLFGVVAYNIYLDAKFSANQARASVRTMATLVANNTARKIEATRQLLAGLAQRPLVRLLDAARCDSVIKDLQVLSPDFANIVYTNMQGDTVCSALPQLQGKAVNVRGTTWYKQLVAEQRFGIGTPHIGPISGKWVSVLSMPIFDAGKQMVGAIHVTMDLNSFDPGLSERDFPVNSRFGLFDADGIMMWRNQDPEQVIGTRPDAPAARRIVQTREGEFEEIAIDGVSRLFAVTTVPEIGWVAFFGVPSKDLYARAWSRAMPTVAISLVGLAVLAWLALMVAHRIERPIRSLALAASGISRGSRDLRAEPSGPTELVHVAQEFNAMVDGSLRAEAAMQQQRRQLQAAKSQLDHAVQVAQLGMWNWDIASGILQMDSILTALCGYTQVERGALSVQEWRDWAHPDDLARHDGQLIGCLKNQLDLYEVELRLKHKDGHWLWGQWKGRVTARDADGRAQHMYGSFQDVSERKRSYQSLQLAASVFTYAREGITITDPQGTIIAVNDSFTKITGYSREEALGQNSRILHSGRQGPDYYATMWREITTRGRWNGEIWNRRKNGEVFPEILSITAVGDADGVVQHYVGMFTDISEAKQHEQRLEYLAHYDALTGLPNRVLLADRLRQSMAQCERRGGSLAVAFLDLDGFKTINDRFGHNVGDDLLLALAQRMKSVLRDGDTLARLGGDEFVAVLVDLGTAQECEPVLERLLHACADSMPLGDVLLQVSASIGVTIYPNDRADADLLLRHADQAMYLAKQAGKNRYHLFDVAQDVSVQSQRETLDHIRTALAARAEFVLYYQPKVNMRTGAVIGAEALIRWQHPERGLLPPADFLPVIENHPLSVAVGEWVIATALQQMADWHSVGLNLPVSVNISALQLQRDNFVERLAAMLAAQPSVEAQSLELEVLETSALEDVLQVSEVMHRVQAMGVRFALDDFGTGYSSLTYLKRLPAEMIKIDQSFVRDMLVDSDDLAIVTGVIGLAKAFKRKVIAEGVETVALGGMLLPLGCELAQGYGIARPMAARDIPAWVTHWRPDPVWVV
jgi:diguanylate cyclase (GGDEF)-like protein/PAS domain S-box-containing protein